MRLNIKDWANKAIGKINLGKGSLGGSCLRLVFGTVVGGRDCVVQEFSRSFHPNSICFQTLKAPRLS